MHERHHVEIPPVFKGFLTSRALNAARLRAVLVKQLAHLAINVFSMADFNDPDSQFIILD